ncbi:hypothetical protein HJD18_04380 [Thermoleophilia bacterium SCSIO 60948]|nr:hypothetical protein HJD18_04380 [Thermoleophilia bacterium SCSIO 60948]
MERVLEARATEGDSEGPAVEADEVRPLPAKRSGAELTPVAQDVRNAALAAAGGIAAGAATMILARATRSAGRGSAIRIGRRRRPAKVVASRSFIVDVHMLGDR